MGYTRADLDLWSDLMARSLACMGARPGDIFHNAYGYGCRPVDLDFRYTPSRARLDHGSGLRRRHRAAGDATAIGARILGAVPSYALNIAEVAAGMGVDLRKLSLRYDVSAPSPGARRLRDDLEAKFGVKAQDVHGLSEIIGPGVASECHEAQSGLHVWGGPFPPR